MNVQNASLVRLGKKLRLDEGITRREVAARAELHPSLIGQFENGRATPPPDSVELARWAEALGWAGSPAALLDEVEADEPAAS